MTRVDRDDGHRLRRRASGTPPRPTGGDVFTRHGGYSSTFPAERLHDLGRHLPRCHQGGRGDRPALRLELGDQQARRHATSVTSSSTSPLRDTTAGKIYVDASNNAPGDPRIGSRSVRAARDHARRLVHLQARRFQNDGGVLAVEMNVIPHRRPVAGDLDAAHRRPTPSAASSTEVGGNRYGLARQQRLLGPRAR